MIVNALAGKPLPVYGDGRNVRDWLYVQRPLRGRSARCWHTAASGETYNVGGWQRDAPTSTSCTRLRPARRAAARSAPGRYDGLDHASSKTAPATTGAMRSTPARSSASSAGVRPRPSRRACARRCAGTSTTSRLGAQRADRRLPRLDRALTTRVGAAHEDPAARQERASSVGSCSARWRRWARSSRSDRREPAAATSRSRRRSRRRCARSRPQ